MGDEEHDPENATKTEESRPTISFFFFFLHDLSGRFQKRYSFFLSRFRLSSHFLSLSLPVVVSLMAAACHCTLLLDLHALVTPGATNLRAARATSVDASTIRRLPAAPPTNIGSPVSPACTYTRSRPTRSRVSVCASGKTVAQGLSVVGDLRGLIACR